MESSVNSNGYRCNSCGTYVWAGSLHSCGITPGWFSQQVTAPTTMYTIQRCPVCEGRGNVPVGFYGRMAVSTGTGPELCRSCDGRGILKVSMFGSVEKVS